MYYSLTVCLNNSIYVFNPDQYYKYVNCTFFSKYFGSLLTYKKVLLRGDKFNFNMELDKELEPEPEQNKLKILDWCLKLFKLDKKNDSDYKDIRFKLLSILGELSGNSDSNDNKIYQSDDWSLAIYADKFYNDYDCIIRIFNNNGVTKVNIVGKKICAETNYITFSLYTMVNNTDYCNASFELFGTNNTNNINNTNNNEMRTKCLNIINDICNNICGDQSRVDIR